MVEEGFNLNMEQVKTIRRFDEVGMLTGDLGLVVELKNGKKFHVIVKEA